MIKTLLFIGTGSFIGGVARYLVSFALGKLIPAAHFPLGTMAVNILGCLAIGLLHGLFERSDIMDSDMRLMLTVGLCGGFTTFSTFMNDNWSLLQNGNILATILYSALSLIFGMIALYAGHAAMR